jgi:hypothetical protein
MVQAVSRRPVIAEVRFRSRVSLCVIYGGQSGTGTGFFPSTSVLSCQFHSTGAPLHGKQEIFVTRLHNKAEGCGASVASHAGPFTQKKQKQKQKKQKNKKTKKQKKKRKEKNTDGSFDARMSVNEILD